jgi:glycosyltransferase involved in cell wall biosynthesis
LRESLLPPGTLRRDLGWTLFRTVEVLLDGGPAATYRKIYNRLRLCHTVRDLLPRAPGASDMPSLNSQYATWLVRHQIGRSDMERMSAEISGFNYAPLISIVIPVSDTEEQVLRRTIESVLAQVYRNWQICLVNDASKKTHIKVMLDDYAESDSRIRATHLRKRLGITGASAEALSMAEGEFVGFLDHDDELSPDALWEVVNWLNRNPRWDLLYSDEDKLAPNGTHVEPFFKPDWNPDLLLSMNYIAHFSVFRKSLLQTIGGFQSDCEGAQDYDLALRFTEQTTQVGHIPKILYHWRIGQGSAAYSPAAKLFAFENGRRAIEKTLLRRNQQGTVQSISPGKYVVRYKIVKPGLVSIIIPTKDQLGLLHQCVTSIEENTNYRHYEIIIVDNNSTDLETLRYLDALSGKHRVLRYSESFNFSAISNYGAEHAVGEYLVFLNNDTQVIETEWLTAMVEQSQRPEVGAVGSKLLYPNRLIQHAGVIVGFFGAAGHSFRNLPDNGTAYFGFADVIRNCSAVTAACMMVRRELFRSMQGFDEELKVVYNDVDFCLRVRKEGYLVVYTPLAVLRHYESATRGRLRPSKEEDLFCRRWHDVIERGDPYYNPNLSLTREDWSLRV